MSTILHLPDSIDIEVLFADCDIDFNDVAIFPKERTDEYKESQERKAVQREQQRARSQRYIENHHDEILERKRKRYAENIEYYRALGLAYYSLMPSEVREQNKARLRERYANDIEYRERVLATNAKSRAKIKSLDINAYYEKRRESGRKFYAEHREQEQARSRAKYAKNKEKHNALTKKWYAEHREEVLAKMREKRLAKKAAKAAATLQQNEKLNLNLNSKQTENKDT